MKFSEVYGPAQEHSEGLSDEDDDSENTKSPFSVLHQEELDGNVSELRAPYFAVYRIPKHTKELDFMAPEFGFSTPAFPLIED